MYKFLLIRKQVVFRLCFCSVNYRYTEEGLSTKITINRKGPLLKILDLLVKIITEEKCRARRRGGGRMFGPLFTYSPTNLMKELVITKGGLKPYNTFASHG